MALKSNGVTQVPDGLGAAGQVLKVNSAGTAGEWGSIAASDNSKLPLTGGTLTGDLQLNSTKKIIFDDFRQYIKGTASLFGTAVTMEIGTGGTPTISATHAGNVGIGTSTPNTKLDVAGDITVSGT